MNLDFKPNSNIFLRQVLKSLRVDISACTRNVLVGTGLPIKVTRIKLENL